MSDLTLLAEVAPRLIFVEDNGDGTTAWRDSQTGADFRLDHRHVIQYSLNERMREGLAREGTPELQGGISEATEPPAEILGRIEGAEVSGGHGDGWQWSAVREQVGDTVITTWAIDNKPSVDAWAKGDRIDPPPALYNAVIPDWVIQAIQR